MAGESIYTLPYALRRDFAPVILEVSEMSSTELGQLSSIFGVFALLCYFPGGWIADRFPARSLMTFSLLSTGALGLGLATLPSFWGMLMLFAALGITTILTFWAALIKATRAWGGATQQGLAFGLLDGGRGVVDALLASTAVLTFSLVGGDAAGLRGVILLMASSSTMAGIWVWFAVRDDRSVESSAPGGAMPSQLLAVVRMPITWLQAVIIVVSFSCFWGTFDLSSYAVDSFGWSSASAASLSAATRWLRPIAALGAGLLADRTSATRAIVVCFVSLIVSYGAFATVPSIQGPVWILWANASAVCLFSFALRGVYYAIMEEADVPVHLTGTTVGVVSVLGFTPDIFVPLILGSLVDGYPGGQGHRLFFAGLSALCCVGLAAAVFAARLTARSRTSASTALDTGRPTEAVRRPS